MGSERNTFFDSDFQMLEIGDTMELAIIRYYRSGMSLKAFDFKAQSICSEVYKIRRLGFLN